MDQDSPMSAETRFTPSDQCVSTEVGSETVLLHLDEGVYFGLNEAGRIIWERLVDGATLAEITQALTTTFSADAESIETDARSFLHDLEKNNLISLQTPA